MESFNEIWEGITRGIPYRGQLKTYTKYEDEKWFRVSYTAVNDMYGEVSKVICLANDVTNERIMEMESRKYTEQLKIQEEKLKLSSVELKKKLDQSRKELEQQYGLVTRERDRMEKTLSGDVQIIISMDQQSRILFLNKSAEKFFGVRSSGVLGKEVRSLFPVDTSGLDPFLLSLFNPDAVKITGEERELRIPDKNGKARPAGIHLSMAELGDEVSYTAFISLH